MPPDSGQPDSGQLEDAGSAADAGLISTAIPLHGCGGTGFTASVVIGNGQAFQLFLDTGSSSLGVVSTACTTCGVISPAYDADAGAVDQGRRASAQYASMPPTGWSGEVYEAPVLIVGAPFAVPLDLVAIDMQSNFFTQQLCHSNGYQGILGLGRGAVAFAGTNTYPDALADAGVPDVLTFALCDSSGTLWLGGPPDASVQYTPMTAEPHFYTLTVSGGLVGDAGLTGDAGQPLQPQDWGGGFVDTGGTALWLPTVPFNAVISALGQSAAFQSVFGDPAAFFSTSTPCRIVTKSAAELDAMLPPLTLLLGDDGGVAVSSPATQSYLRPQSPGCYLPALYEMTGSRGALPPIELGAPFLRGKTVVIDRARQRIGFGPATCP
jgi:hypothetical protein